MSFLKSKSDLIQNARLHLHFLHLVDKHRPLYQENVVQEALYRYENFWLVLAAKHEKFIIPPLDIHWVWHVHMLAPKIYEKDCKAIVGKVVEARFPKSADEVVRALIRTKKYWYQSWPNEKFEIHHDEDWPKLVPRSRPSQISYDIKAAVTRQRSFNYQVLLPHYTDKDFLRTAHSRYLMFLRLKRLHPSKFLVPCYDIDLMRHTHQAEPLVYAEETTAYLGKRLDHDDTVHHTSEHSILTKSYQKTKELWNQTYGQDFEYSKEGCMYRGEPPSCYTPDCPHECSFLKEMEAQLLKNTVNDYSLKIMHVELKNCHEQFSTLNVYRRGRNNVEKKIFTLKDPPAISSQGRRECFHFDAVKHSQLTIVLKRPRTRRYFKKAEVLGRCDFAFVNDQERDWSSFREVNCNLRLESEGNEPIATVVEMKMENLSVQRGPLSLRVRPSSFTTIPNPPPQMWGPIPQPSPHPGRPEYPDEVHTATHMLRTHTGMTAYMVQVIHGLKAGMAAVLVRSKQDFRIISEAHVIGPDQLPLHSQLRRPGRCISLSPNAGRNEIAMVIRDSDGDWGICVGRWAAYEFSNNYNAKRAESVGKKNPGFLHVRFYSLKKETMKRIFVPSRCLHGFSFDFNLDDLYMDLEEGHLLVSKECRDHAQNIALAFSISLLFSLCQPCPTAELSSHPPNTHPSFPSVSTLPYGPGEFHLEDFPSESGHNLPPPKYTPFKKIVRLKRVRTNQDLVFLMAAGHWLSHTYPLYYQPKVGKKQGAGGLRCNESLVWDDRCCGGVHDETVDITNSLPRARGMINNNLMQGMGDTSAWLLDGAFEDGGSVSSGDDTCTLHMGP